MPLNITFFNWRGSMGKSTLSYLAYKSLTEESKNKYAVVTNEASTVLLDIVSRNRLKILEENEVLPQYPKEIGVIFDLGGFTDSRVVEAIKQSKYVVIQIIYKNSKLNYASSLSCALEVAKINPNVVLVANMAQKGDFERLSKVSLNKDLKKYKLPVFEIKNSTSVARALDEKRTLQELVKCYPQHKKPFSVVADQFENLLNYIKK